jgi:iron complex transport system ATP-binding protein
MSLLQTEKLAVSIDGRVLIHDLNWQVERGQFWCVLGKNGVGKSSLLYVLAGLMPRAGGSLLIAGASIDTTTPTLLAQRRGMMLQQHADNFAHSVLDTVLVGRMPYRAGSAWDTDEDVAAAQAALAMVGLPGKSHIDINHLSGGERQRVALASLLAQNPHLMLLDEPVAHQDVAQQLVVMQLLSDLKQDHALIASCHDINLAARFATHALILGEGRHWAGEVEEVMQPAILEQAFSCKFIRQEKMLIAV